MIYLILDIFFYNYTSFKTCLFLLNVNNKNILYNFKLDSENNYYLYSIDIEK